MKTEKIDYIEVELEIENVTFKFEVVGTYTPESGDGFEEERRDEEFEIDNLFYTSESGECKDVISLLDWPHIEASVIEQLKSFREEV